MADVAIGLGSYTETDVASASTCDIGAATTLKVRITGTTGITSFGTSANRIRFIRFAAALTLTHNGTSLILPTAANITTAAGDTCTAMSDASGNWRVTQYQLASGKALDVSDLLAKAGGTMTGALTISPAAGSNTLTVEANALSTILAKRSDAAAGGPRFEMRKSRGSLSSPGVVVLNDIAGSFRASAYDGAAFVDVVRIDMEMAEATPAAGVMGSRARIFINLTGTSTSAGAEMLRVDSAGWSMGGANPVVDANRHHQLRSYTVAGLPPATTAGQMIYVSNETGGAVPAFADGSNWRRVTDRAVVS